jgi:hypothetical protein
MNRHSLIARFGVADTKAVPLAQPDSQATTIDFVGGNKRFDFGLGTALEQLEQMGLAPSECAFDLLVLAALAFGADTRVNRDSESQDG